MTSDAVPTCCWCGGNVHAGICPPVKAVEYDHGVIRRVEFKCRDDLVGTFPQSNRESIAEVVRDMLRNGEPRLN